MNLENASKSHDNLMPADLLGITQQKLIIMKSLPNLQNITSYFFFYKYPHSVLTCRSEFKHSAHTKDWIQSENILISNQSENFYI